MSDFQSLLSERMRSSKDNAKKMNELGQKTTTGELSGFSGIFKISPLTQSEKENIQNLLTEHRLQEQDISKDLTKLQAITSEVKAINNQAIILHGERIKQAQKILKSYKEGAFSAWLISTYGNRQTPYNFLQYYEFYVNTSNEIQKCIDLMPKQAIYTLASREGPIEEKISLIKDYKGESKQTLLEKIRDLFPLSKSDKRNSKLSSNVIKKLDEILHVMKKQQFSLSKSEKKAIYEKIKEIKSLC